MLGGNTKKCVTLLHNTISYRCVIGRETKTRVFVWSFSLVVQWLLFSIYAVCGPCCYPPLIGNKYFFFMLLIRIGECLLSFLKLPGHFPETELILTWHTRCGVRELHERSSAWLHHWLQAIIAHDKSGPPRKTWNKPVANIGTRCRPLFNHPVEEFGVCHAKCGTKFCYRVRLVSESGIRTWYQIVLLDYGTRV